MKFPRNLVLAVAAVVVAASIAVWCLSTEAQERVTGDFWTCVFEFRQQTDKPQPLTRIYVHAPGRTEGEAAINAHKAICERLTTHAQEQLIFVEAQNKGEKK